MKPKKLVTKKRLAGAVATVAAFAIVLGGTFAWSDFTQHKTNALSGGGSFDLTLNDSFTPPGNWVPGSPAVDKKVSVTNTVTSGSEAYLRIQIKEYLEDYSMVPVTDNGKEVLFATYADGAKKGEFMTWADAVAGGYDYTQYTVDGVDYARTQNAELRNGIYGKHMYLAGPLNVYGSATKADYPNQPHEQQSSTNPECNYNVHEWMNCGITDGDGDTIHNHITWNLGTQTMTMAEWIAAGEHTGDFWVLDTDGWAYWANALPPNATTANVMESVQLLNMPGDQFEYYIHIDMEAVTADELDLFVSNGATASAQLLIGKLKAGGSGWTDNGDGTATQYILINGQLEAGLTVIIGLDGIPGTADDNCIVNPTGLVLKTGVSVEFDGGVPCVDLGNGFKLYPGADGKIGTLDDVITGFGTFAQSDTTGVVREPISWRLLDIKDGNAIIVTEKILDRVRYSTIALGNNWTTSNYRSYLNGPFYNGVFSAEEKLKLVDTSNGMPAETLNLLNGVLGVVNITLPAQPGTTDKVWALSATEAIKYFGLTEQGYLNAHFEGTPYAINRGLHVDSSGPYAGCGNWLTRSGGITPLLTACTVIPDGGINGAMSVLDNTCGPLAVVTVKLTA